MKNSQLLVALLIVVLGMFMFAGCGSKSEPAEEPAEEPAATEVAATPNLELTDGVATIRLDVDTAAGYIWDFTIDDETIVEEATSEVSEGTGTDGLDQFCISFRGLKEGTTNVKFSMSTGQDEGGPTELRQATFVVDADGKINDASLDTI